MAEDRVWAMEEKGTPRNSAFWRSILSRMLTPSGNPSGRDPGQERALCRHAENLVAGFQKLRIAKGWHGPEDAWQSRRKCQGTEWMAAAGL